jgi:hypothetical protein
VAQPDGTPTPAELLPQGRGTSLAERVRERWKAPVPTEETRDRPAAHARSPWREDLPSPRCVWDDYRAGAAHYGGGGKAVALIYWAVSAIPLAVHMLAAAGHIASQRPGRFWAVALATAIFTVCLLAFS